jgi:hypothetical protein
MIYETVGTPAHVMQLSTHTQKKERTPGKHISTHNLNKDVSSPIKIYLHYIDTYQESWKGELAYSCLSRRKLKTSLQDATIYCMASD